MLLKFDTALATIGILMIRTWFLEFLFCSVFGVQLGLVISLRCYFAIVFTALGGPRLRKMYFAQIDYVAFI